MNTAPYDNLVIIFKTGGPNYKGQTLKVINSLIKRKPLPDIDLNKFVLSLVNPNLDLLGEAPQGHQVKLGQRIVHPMAVPVLSISCCVSNHRNLFYQIQNALAFNRDMCCHLALCLRLLPFHWNATPKTHFP